MIVSLRHEATPFGFNDAMWEKYKIGEALRFRSARQAAAARSADTARLRRTHASTRRLDPGGHGHAKSAGVTHCARSPATARTSRSAHSRRSASPASTREKRTCPRPMSEADLLANLVPNCRPVAAGVIIVNRAQETRVLVPLRRLIGLRRRESETRHTAKEHEKRETKLCHSCFYTTLSSEEPQVRIELTTARLRIECSTTELLWRALLFFCQMPWCGLEPQRLSAPPPQDGVSTNFTTRANYQTANWKRQTTTETRALSKLDVSKYGSDGARTRDLSSDSRVL